MTAVDAAASGPEDVDVADNDQTIIVEFKRRLAVVSSDASPLREIINREGMK